MYTLSVVHFVYGHIGDVLKPGQTNRYEKHNDRMKAYIYCKWLSDNEVLVPPAHPHRLTINRNCPMILQLTKRFLYICIC